MNGAEALAALGNACKGTRCPIVVRWAKVPKGRTEFIRQAIQAHDGSFPLLVCQRLTGFVDADAVNADVLGLLADHRALVEEQLNGQYVDRPLGILLVTKTDLPRGVSGSFVDVPDWHPHLGGKCVEVDFDGADYDLLIPLDDSRACHDDLEQAVLEFDAALCRGLIAACSGDGYSHVRDFLRMLDVGCDGTKRGCVQALERSMAVSRKRTGFRPEANGVTLSEAIWMHVYDVSITDLDTLARHLGKACEVLASEEPSLLSIRECMPAVLIRPRNKNLGPENHFARNAVMACFGACQFLTVGHHADQYEGYPAELVVWCSWDLRDALRLQAEVLTLLS